MEWVEGEIWLFPDTGPTPIYTSLSVEVKEISEGEEKGSQHFIFREKILALSLEDFPSEWAFVTAQGDRGYLKPIKACFSENLTTQSLNLPRILGHLIYDYAFPLGFQREISSLQQCFPIFDSIVAYWFIPEWRSKWKCYRLDSKTGNISEHFPHNCDYSLICDVCPTHKAKALVVGFLKFKFCTQAPRQTDNKETNLSVTLNKSLQIWVVSPGNILDAELCFDLTQPVVSHNHYLERRDTESVRGSKRFRSVICCCTRIHFQTDTQGSNERNDYLRWPANWDLDRSKQ